MSNSELHNGDSYKINLDTEITFGRKPKIPKTKSFTARIDREELMYFKEACSKRGVTQSEVIQSFMKSFVAQMKKLDEAENTTGSTTSDKA